MALSALVNLGAMQRELGDHQATIHYNRQALTQAREIGGTVGIIVSSLNLTMEYCLQGQPDQARPLLTEALQLARRIGSDTWLAAGLVGIGAIHLADQDIPTGLGILGMARSHPAAGGDEAKEIQYVVGGLLGDRLSASEIEAGMKTLLETSPEILIDEFLAVGSGSTGHK